LAGAAKKPVPGAPGRPMGLPTFFLAFRISIHFFKMDQQQQQFPQCLCGPGTDVRGRCIPICVVPLNPHANDTNFVRCPMAADTLAFFAEQEAMASDAREGKWQEEATNLFLSWCEELNLNFPVPDFRESESESE
jgi:hypothetical protein